MDKKFRIIFFFICLGGGILFAIPFFFAFGSTSGYTWDVALICLGGGIIWAVLFYIVWIVVEKFAKPFSFENKKAQKKLLNFETAHNLPYERRFFAHMSCGKGHRQEVCEAHIYFQADRIYLLFCHLGKIRDRNIPYQAIDRAYVTDGNVLVINSSELGNSTYSVKNTTPRALIEVMVEKGIYKETSSHLRGNLFLTDGERAGTAYLEFQYCKKTWGIKRLVKDGYGYWEEDSLLVHIDDAEVFFSNYGIYLEPTNAPNGSQEFSEYGVNYYTREQTLSILKSIKADKPQDFETLFVWLKKAVEEYNGFFFLGI